MQLRDRIRELVAQVEQLLVVGLVLQHVLDALAVRHARLLLVFERVSALLEPPLLLLLQLQLLQLQLLLLQLLLLRG